MAERKLAGKTWRNVETNFLRAICSAINFTASHQEVNRSLGGEKLAPIHLSIMCRDFINNSGTIALSRRAMFHEADDISYRNAEYTPHYQAQ
jgi:hypothetical protein